MAGIIVMGIFIFIAGYFWGKKSFTEDIMNDVMQESLADQVYSSLYYADTPSPSVEQQDIEEEQEIQADDLMDELALPEEKNNDSNSSVTVSEPLCNKYVVELISFSSHKAAQAFVEKTARHYNWIFIIKERKSITKKGKTILWYQVISEPFALIEEAQKFAKEASQKLHISGYQVVNYQ